MEKIKEFEDSINTIWTKEQLEEIGVYAKMIEESAA
jgi:hypothetical protein